MKKKTKPAKRKRELANLEAIGLTPDQLNVIRKLNGPKSIAGNSYRATLINETYSNRTFEAVLLGRRFNAEILHAAIYSAKEQLQRLTNEMKEIESIINKR
jgi:hypothetical protein